MTDQIKRGQIVYNPYSGQTAQYVGRIDEHRHIVNPQLEVEEVDDEGYGRHSIIKGPMEEWTQISLTPPKAHIEKSLVAQKAEWDQLSTQCAEMRGQISQARSEMWQVDREREAQKKRLDEDALRIPALQRVADFEAGRITHVVMSTSVEIIIKPIADLEKKDDDDYYNRKGTKLPLLMLAGNSKGNLSFYIAEGTNYIGSNIKETRLASSEENANEIAKAWAMEIGVPILNAYADAPSDTNIKGVGHMWNGYRLAKTWGFDIPQSIIDFYEQKRLDGINEQVELLRYQHAEITRRLEAALRGETPNPVQYFKPADAPSQAVPAAPQTGN